MKIKLFTITLLLCGFTALASVVHQVNGYERVKVGEFRLQIDSLVKKTDALDVFTAQDETL